MHYTQQLELGSLYFRNNAMASDDIHELRDQIKRLTASIKQGEEEQQRLQKETTSLENKLASLKMEGNVLLALDQVRFQDLTQRTPDEENIGSKSFLEADLKLELSILNADIRRILPALEKEALIAEERFQVSADALSKQNKRKSKLFSNSTSNEDKDVEELQDKRQRLQGKMPSCKSKD
jgi:uncharacterized protein YlxW (UPF0749 family)